MILPGRIEVNVGWGVRRAWCPPQTIPRAKGTQDSNFLLFRGIYHAKYYGNRGGAGNGQWQVMLSHINELLHQGQEWVGGKVDQTDQTVPTRLQQGDSYKSFSARFVHTKN